MRIRSTGRARGEIDAGVSGRQLREFSYTSRARAARLSTSLARASTREKGPPRAGLRGRAVVGANQRRTARCVFVSACVFKTLPCDSQASFSKRFRRSASSSSVSCSRCPTCKRASGASSARFLLLLFFELKRKKTPLSLQIARVAVGLLRYPRAFQRRQRGVSYTVRRCATLSTRRTWSFSRSSRTGRARSTAPRRRRCRSSVPRCSPSCANSPSSRSREAKRRRVFFCCVRGCV